MDAQQAGTIGAKVRRARKAKNWNQRELADAAGVAPGTVVSVEQGRTVRPGNLRAVLDTLGIPPESVVPTEPDAETAMVLDIVRKWYEQLPQEKRRDALMELTRFTVLGDW